MTDHFTLRNYFGSTLEYISSSWRYFHLRKGSNYSKAVHFSFGKINLQKINSREVHLLLNSLYRRLFLLSNTFFSYHSQTTSLLFLFDEYIFPSWFHHGLTDEPPMCFHQNFILHTKESGFRTSEKCLQIRNMKNDAILKRWVYPSNIFTFYAAKFQQDKAIGLCSLIFVRKILFTKVERLKHLESTRKCHTNQMNS